MRKNNLVRIIMGVELIRKHYQMRMEVGVKESSKKKLVGVYRLIM